MTRRIAKRDLPTKICAVCGRPFQWRRKWARDWEEVRYCSDACRRRRSEAGTGNPTDPPKPGRAR